jgi:hypothetical protein
VTVFFIATAHDEYRTRRFPPGSVVIDPWRMIPDQPGVTVRRLGENKPATISILLPSRGRPDMFARLYHSIWTNAIYPRQIELVVRLDADDETKFEYPDPGPVQITYVVGARRLLSESWNECYRLARGEILMHCGDDVTFNTPGWDQVIRAEFAQSEDKILLVHGDDLSPNTDDLATHGFVHRRWVETVGYFLPPLFSSDWNDVWLTEVADVIGRRVKVPIVTEHHHWSLGKSELDRTHSERIERGESDDVEALYERTVEQRAYDADKLRAACA